MNRRVMDVTIHVANKDDRVAGIMVSMDKIAKVVQKSLTGATVLLDPGKIA